MKSLQRNVDVAVLGGGPAGSATALALAHDGISVALIEQSGYDNVRVGETLPPEVATTLRNLGSWDQFLRDAHYPSSSIRYAWGHPDLGESDFIFNPYGTGWHIDRGRFDAMLARIAEEAGVSTYTDARWTPCSESATASWELCVVHGVEKFVLSAKFLVDATGRACTLARKKGARRVSYDGLVGIVGFLSVPDKNPLGDCTLLEAVEDGWWYSARIPGSRLVVVYMTDADLCAASSDRPIRFWWQQIHKTTHTQALVSPYPLQRGPFVVAANSSRLNEFSGRAWLAVGDAAVAYDPLSSQGVYKALESGARGAQAIRNYFAGDRTALQSYAAETEEHFDHYLIMRNNYYSRETRWPQSAFWRRRKRVTK